MKVIDLLVKIANREEVPKKIKYRKDIYLYNSQYENYYLESKSVCGLHSLFNILCTDGDLNDEIEIIEEVEKPREIEQIMTKKDKYNNINELSQEVFKAFETIDELVNAVNYLLKKEELSEPNNNI